MYKTEKKVIALLLSLLISSSILSTVSGISIIDDDFKHSDYDTIKKVITLFRYGLDGSVIPIKVEIEINPGDDINDKVEEKCITLLKGDSELQKILNNNITKNNLCLIISRGRGLHIKFNLPIIWPINNKISQLVSSDSFSNIHIPIIYCRYSNDEKAFTNVYSLFHTNSSNTTNGPHSVLCIGFYGYKWWLGHLSLRGFIFRAGFVGFSIYTRINNF